MRADIQATANEATASFQCFAACVWLCMHRSYSGFSASWILSSKQQYGRLFFFLSGGRCPRNSRGRGRFERWRRCRCCFALLCGFHIN
jgi:hypothetical protein